MRCLQGSSWLLVATGVLLTATDCVEEVVQTATLGPVGGADSGIDGRPALLECTGAAPENKLPSGTAFGERDTMNPWPLVGHRYGASQGPGILVTARDSFRLYINGHLTAASQSARSPVFVPISLMPGENVIALSVAAATGTPAAIVQLDDLERAYVSGSGWKLSLDPQGDWRSRGYDDSRWLPAAELARAGELPGCDPSDVSFREAARWIGPSLGTVGPVALRATVRLAPTGFAAGTTGGADAEPVRVSDWETLEALAGSDEPRVLLLDEGTYDFRRQGADVTDQWVCSRPCPEAPSKTYYGVLLGGATCPTPLVTVKRNERRLAVKSNKTILGLGRGAALRGVTIDLADSKNVILRNIAVYDINPSMLEAGDAIGLWRSNGVWIDHATTKWVSDGLIDMREGTRNVTLSYVFFDGENEATCTGHHPLANEFTNVEATIHHSRYDHVATRAPMVRGLESRVHLLNNVASNSTDWIFGSSCDAQVLVEGNTFENVVAATFRGGCDGGGLGLMRAPAGSNLYRGDSNVHRGADGQEPRDDVFSPSYVYEAEPATEAWPRVVSRAGAGGPWALPLVRN